MRRSIIACGLLLALAGIPSALAATASDAGGSPAAEVGPTGASGTSNDDAQRIAYWNDKAHRAQVVTARWLTAVHGRPPRPFTHTSDTSSPAAAQELARKWHRRAVATARLAKNPPHLDAWNCIHSYEGSWSDPDAPYWGGLQMDMNFQSAYGPWLLKHKGTANRWTPLQQIWAGVRAWRVRGFSPWSTTAHACGVY